MSGPSRVQVSYKGRVSPIGPISCHDHRAHSKSDVLDIDLKMKRMDGAGNRSAPREQFILATVRRLTVNNIFGARAIALDSLHRHSNNITGSMTDVTDDKSELDKVRSRIANSEFFVI